MTESRLEIHVDDDGIHTFPELQGRVYFYKESSPVDSEKVQWIMVGEMISPDDGEKVVVHIPLDRETLLSIKDPSGRAQERIKAARSKN